MSRLAANPTPSLDGDSEADFDGSMVESELHRVQRLVRHLESERKGYSEEMRATFMRQQNTLENLRKENDIIKDDLKLLKSLLESQKKVGSGSKKAEVLKEQSETFHQKIKAASLQTNILDKKLIEMEKAVSKQRETVSSRVSTQKGFAAQKQTIALESRLEKFLIRYNKSLEVNGKLRDTVNVLRHERCAFDAVYKRYEKELNELKKQIAEISESCANSYESREECQTRMVALKERNEKETQSFQQEIKELERQLEQDRKLKEFLIIKTAERSDFVDNVRKHLHTAPVVKGSQELLVEKMDNYEMAFENIKQLTKCNDINDLVKRFSQIEDENFSLFNYVNEINNQFEAINNEISQIQRQIDDLKSANAEEEGAQNKRIAEFEQKLKATEALTDQYNKQYEISAQSLESIRKFVGNLADVLKLPPVESDSTVSKVPVSKQLASIEQKINEMLMKNLLLALPKKFITAAMPPAGSGANATAAQGNKEGQSEANADKPQAQSDATKDPVALAALLQTLIDSGELSQSEGDTLHGLLGQGPNAPVTSLAVRAPNTVDDLESENEEEDTERPMSRNAVKEKAMRRLIKREQQIQQESVNSGLPAASLSTAKAQGQKQHRRKASKRQE